MKINSVLKKEIKNIKGSLLGFGLDLELTKQIDKNDNITICNLINSITEDSNEKGKNKKFKISKLRKKFKKKRTNYIICNYEEIKKYTNKFIKDSIYLTNDKVYIYVTDFEIKKMLEHKYSRYNTNIESIKCTDGYIIIINTNKAKNNKIKEFIYDVIDIFMKGIDILTEILLS